ncbi:hypothetical protein WJ59_31355 [Burkholderia gladioli]|uniref:hypothetical protein n=1 Tax=Burkholderia gladioli TaxID=28095 RepID=UPI0007550719|nr:hypothetical protein [Burkholderia gladioli]KVM59760.1 hypothetical protein WJ59_31355 [Burkholderia gladioli]
MALATIIISHLQVRFANRRRMDWHHLAVALLAILIAAILTAVGLRLRIAALRGDSAVRAGRAAVNQFFHSQNAVSCLEHMVSGFGMALIGFAVLQLAYFDISGVPRAVVEPKSVPTGLRWTVIAVVALLAAWSVAQYAYHGTTLVIAAATLIAVPLCLVYHERLKQMAIAVPQRMIALAAAPLWLIAELAWKVSRWTMAESHWVVAAQLTGSLLVLLATSAGAGALVRRFRCLALKERMEKTPSLVRSAAPTN